MPRIGIIVVAGGSGSRMGASVPKQFLPLAGKPILVHTVERLLQALPDAQIVIALPQEETDKWHDISREYGLDGTHTVTHGGATRFESVKNALAHIKECDIVAVHDGVRPFVSEGLIERVISSALSHGTAVPAIAPADSFRTIAQDGHSQPTDRTALRAVQTPQAFSYELLRKAYDVAEYAASFTDDASVVEHYGSRIHLCEGDPANIKITTPFHMTLAQALLDIENGTKI